MARKTTNKTVSATSDDLVQLALQAADSSSNYEDILCDAALRKACDGIFETGEDADIETALHSLKADDDTSAYDALLAMAEDCAQSYTDERGCHQLVLIPILAWSRYQIPCCRLDKNCLKSLADLLRSCFSSPQASVTMGDTLISADNLPEQLIDVRGLLRTLTAGRVQHGAVVSIAKLLRNEPPADFSDSRYIVAAISAPTPGELFVPQDKPYIERMRSIMDFSLAAHDVLWASLIGSVFEVQAPSGFYSAWRQTETAMRVFCLKSLVSFVCCMNFVPQNLLVTTALFTRPGESAEGEGNSEIRIGVSTKDKPNSVIAGVVWSMVNEDPDALQQFAADILRTEGVDRIVALDQVFPMEWCEDCGAPLYATSTGQVAHIEMPEEIQIEKFAPTLN